MILMGTKQKMRSSANTQYCYSQGNVDNNSRSIKHEIMASMCNKSSSMTILIIIIKDLCNRLLMNHMKGFLRMHFTTVSSGYYQF